MYKPTMRHFLFGDIYGLTSAPHSLGRSNVAVVEQMIAAGIKVIQYREKDKEKGPMYHECIAIREMTRQADVTFIINDHIDLAMLVGADGVHIGQDDLPPQQVRQLVGPDAIIGLSTHSPQQAQAAVYEGIVDYIGVGPIFSTQTKRNVCDAVGVEYLAYVANHIKLPYVAIGGIKEHNLRMVRQHGGKIIALVTDIVGAEDIPAKVASIRKVLSV